MIAFTEARDRILAAARRMPSVALPLPDCLGLVLAADVSSPCLVPSFDNSAMDGFAVRAKDVSDVPVRLPVVVTSAAGCPAARGIAPGQAARILTGAMMVEGADTVVPVEATVPADVRDGGDVAWVEIRKSQARGANVRRAGEDMAMGDVFLRAGAVLGVGHLGLAASVGLDCLRVVPRPRVAVISTGSELVAPGSGPLRPGQIYDSNSTTVAAALRCRCGVRDISHAHIGDDPDVLASELKAVAMDHDIVITTGGVSMGGEYDVVKEALAGNGVDFWQVAIKPAKPMAFGHIGDAFFFGLPGNPVSALVSVELFVRPFVRALLGIEPAVPPLRHGELGEVLNRPDDGKTHFVRVVRFADGRYRKAGAQGSHQLHSLAAASGLAVLRPGKAHYEPGSMVEVIDLVQEV